MMRNRGILWLMLFLLALAAETGYCFLHPIAYFDTFAYVSLAETSMDGTRDGRDYLRAGERCTRELPGAYSGCAEVRSSAVFHQASALSAADYGQFLRFYRVKPLYNGLTRLLRVFVGGDSFLALRLLSSISFAAIGVLVVLWLWRMVPPAVASAGALCLMSLPGTIGLGRGLLPDALLTVLLLAGAYLVTGKRSWWIGAVVLLAAVLVRADALLFAAALGAVAIWHDSAQPIRWLRLVALAAGTMALAHVVGWLTGALPWRVLFVHSFLAWTPPSDYFSLHVSMGQYLHVLQSNGVRTVLFCLPLPALLGLLALAGRRTALRAVVWAGLGAVALRVLLYPGVEDRYYVWLTLLAGIGTVAAVRPDETPPG